MFREKNEKRKPPASLGTRGTNPEAFPPARCDSRAHSLRLKAPGFGPRAPTIAPRAIAPGLRPAGANRYCLIRANRDMAARKRGLRIPEPAECGLRVAIAADRTGPPISGSTDARAGSDPLPVVPIPPVESPAEWRPGSRDGPRPADRHKRCSLHRSLE